MSKRKKSEKQSEPREWRKSRPMRGTIFDKDLLDDVVALQRRNGLFYRHGINPAAVKRPGTVVESRDHGKVEVFYEAVYVPEGLPSWPERSTPGGQFIPPGIWCEHGGYKKRHTVVQIKSFMADAAEVLR